MKKFLFVVLILLLFNGKNSNAETKDSFSHLIDKLETVELEGKTEYLYKQFKSQTESLKCINEEYSDLFEFVKNKYSLGKITENNWMKYYEIFQTEDLLPKYEDDILFIKKFFDIFENKYKNDRIKTRLAFLKIIRNGDSYDKELLYLMPNSSKYSNKYLKSNVKIEAEIEKDLKNSKIKSSGMLRVAPTNLPNQRAAIDYAKRYATNPNTSKYYYFSRGDCANFVSQIFEAGGRKQIVYSGGYTKKAGGWWHITNPHRHSPAWSLANTFVCYFGTHVTTKNHRVFTAQLNPGTVIAFDSADDGDWDHVAYVTDSDNYTANYNGKYYYDYKVAQHTKNYNEWTSSSKNNWEKIEDIGGRYAVVRD
ncbi:amidase domain-containing protein [Parvimonas micra]|uniref:Amidase domain-containing protein n=1 Tax=Parvimonas micra TaxID=33033 RepID=A0A9X3H9T2_9FIRM|nr:amidase domain-containing protein [Parvimonas micra]MCZ7406834.1 amidase domain-containing protein [Parvimonas micra]MCZ7410035.1 amidase domain-containing protein [Parvimonas micra]MCZ7411803.1 amidase domain-containing protein [Parvimonas micra]WBB37707.1 amidase domain-containing protein [Parvimonas micra]